MGRQNKKANVAAFHKETIMNAAEKLFSEKGVSATTIDDISEASEYSRRTIYAYFENKEMILYHIIAKGLTDLRDKIIQTVADNTVFLEQYFMICNAIKEYHSNSPQSFESVNRADTKDIDISALPPIVAQIFSLGTEINSVLADFIEKGKKTGVIKTEVQTMKTVYILWASITALLSLVQSKGEFIEKEFITTQTEFLEYGYKQIINSILVERI
jgi:AcrR family transcriptional regulator